ncbi:hypothetical protein FACS1894177_07440 [Bacteroidia bacterium]|nr:hypothetical protein FACS1894177_07440 [Bacteroidia bacterium]
MRFTIPDPLQEKYYSISPYAYCGNNPVNRIDPTGMDWIEDKYGNVAWYKDITKNNVPKGYKYIGTEYEGIAILKYDGYTDKYGTKYLEIQIGYKGKSGDNSYNWVQTVEKDDRSEFVDIGKSKAGQENYPFYQDKKENQDSQKDGYDITFYDMPTENDRNGSFKAELSLIGGRIEKNSQSYIKDSFSSEGAKIMYAPKITLGWGFSVKNNTIIAAPIKVIKPSPFHRKIINSIK